MGGGGEEVVPLYLQRGEGRRYVVRNQGKGKKEGITHPESKSTGVYVVKRGKKKGTVCIFGGGENESSSILGKGGTKCFVP